MTTRRVIFPPAEFWNRNQLQKGTTSMTTNEPIGSPNNPFTKRAPLDAVLLAQALERDDEPAQQAILANCDPYSVALQIAGFLLGTFHHFDVDAEERFTIWLEQTRDEIGEGTQ